ncbi:hypothetical protein IO90_09735 [Chryseobacterium sp. FH1]|nr:hypothetical protein IO90_09735 [Chryseobacterium sp. FH1]
MFFKTWNYIKYYHPDLASGKVSADSLFLVNVKEINSKDDFNSIITKLTSKLNEKFTISAPLERSKDVMLQNQNFDWFQKNKKISTKNKDILNKIYEHRYNFEKLPKDKLVSDEKEYTFPKSENIPYGYRLLSLAKIQGVIDYLFPHKYIMDKGFDEYFKKSLDGNSQLKTRKDFEIILAGLVSKLKDSHAISFYKQLHYRKDIYNMTYLAPFDFQIVDDHILITHLIIPEICSKAQISVGDKIISINGKSISQIIKEKGKLLSASNDEKLIHYLSKYENNLIWPDNLPQKTLQLKSTKSNKKVSTKIEMIDTSKKASYEILVAYVQDKIKKAESRQLDHEDIAYFKISNTYGFIEDVENDKIDAKMDSILYNASQKKAIVFDMRAYPDWGGFPYHYIYKYFSPAENYFFKYYAPNLKNIGTFVYIEDEAYYFPKIKDKETHVYQGKVFFLVNPETRSASEWYSMSLQKIFPQSLTIGQQTSGADGDLVKVNLPGDYILEFTGNGIFYPDNSQTQQTGIRINEIIKYKDQDILDKKDLEFERVLNSLK